MDCKLEMSHDARAMTSAREETSPQARGTMPFYDKAAYSSNLQAKNAESATLIFALAFTSDSSRLVTATTAGRLAFRSLPPAAPSTSTIALPDSPSINALLSIDDHIYAATDAGLHVFNCDHPTLQGPIVPGCVNALASFDDAVLAATSHAVFLIKDGGHQIMNLPRVAYPHCIASLSSNSFLVGCDDGTLRTCDIRNQHSVALPVSDLIPRPFITSIALNNDKNFALVADSARTLTSIHLPTGSIVATTTTPFIPQALAFCDQNFYCGGSSAPESSAKSLMRYNVRCMVQGSAPVSVDSVYAFAHSKSGALAAAGYCLNRKQLVDVYDNPPVRSYSLPV